MKKTFLILFPFIIFAGTLPFLPSAAPKHASLSISPEAWDLGKVSEGKVYSQAFKVCNKGKSTLKISKIRHSCGCTTTKISTTEISSFDCASFEARLNTRKMKGKSKKKIWIHSNDPEHEITLIDITVEVIP
jgi:hypothetical protein